MRLINTIKILCCALLIFVATFFLKYYVAFAQCTVEYYYETGTFLDSFSTNETTRTEAAAVELLMYDIGKASSQPGSTCPPPRVEDIICESGCCTYPHHCNGPFINTACITGTYTVEYTIPVPTWRATWDVICPSTLINLPSFTATPKSGKVIIDWSTESEADNAGFNLYRSTTEDGEYLKINDSLIPAQGSSTEGASYEFIDSNVKNRKTYYYKLEDIDLNGKSTMHGPVSAAPRLIYRLRK
jgi:hypothetical protein